MEMQTKVHKNVVKNNIKEEAKARARARAKREGEAVVGQVCEPGGGVAAATVLQKIINIKRKLFVSYQGLQDFLAQWGKEAKNNIIKQVGYCS